VNVFKVLQGTVKHDDVLANSRTKGDERIHQLFTMRGKEQDTVTEVAAGDIAAVAKLPTPAPATCSPRRARPRGRDLPRAGAGARGRDQARVEGRRGQARERAAPPPGRRSGPAIERNPETHQTVLRGMGETHLSIALEKLHAKFGVEVDTEEVRVAYRETITGTAEAEGKSRSRAAATASSPWRGCASSPSARRAATSSSTRSSVA
jgi:elongation factor G